MKIILSAFLLIFLVSSKCLYAMEMSAFQRDPKLKLLEGIDLQNEEREARCKKVSEMKGIRLNIAGKMQFLADYNEVLERSAIEISTNPEKALKYDGILKDLTKMRNYLVIDSNKGDMAETLLQDTDDLQTLYRCNKEMQSDLLTIIPSSEDMSKSHELLLKKMQLLMSIDTLLNDLPKNQRSLYFNRYKILESYLDCDNSRKQDLLNKLQIFLKEIQDFHQKTLKDFDEKLSDYLNILSKTLDCLRVGTLSDERNEIEEIAKKIVEAIAEGPQLSQSVLHYKKHLDVTRKHVVIIVQSVLDQLELAISDSELKDGINFNVPREISDAIMQVRGISESISSLNRYTFENNAQISKIPSPSKIDPLMKLRKMKSLFKFNPGELEEYGNESDSGEDFSY